MIFMQISAFFIFACFFHAGMQILPWVVFESDAALIRHSDSGGNAIYLREKEYCNMKCEQIVNIIEELYPRPEIARNSAKLSQNKKLLPHEVWGVFVRQSWEGNKLKKESV